jgi:hypothetical protein
MAEIFLTDSEVLEIVCGSEESFSDSSDSVSSSDNEIDDIAVAVAIINYNSDKEQEILYRDFTGHRELFGCDFGPRNVTVNISHIVQYFELFLTKKS